MGCCHVSVRQRKSYLRSMRRSCSTCPLPERERMLNNPNLTSQCWLEELALADLTRLTSAPRLTPQLTPRLTTLRAFLGGWRRGPDGVYGIGVINVVASSSTTVDVPPIGKASDVREILQYRWRSGLVDPKLKELRTQVLDQGCRWIY